MWCKWSLSRCGWRRRGPLCDDKPLEQGVEAYVRTTRAGAPDQSPYGSLEGIDRANVGSERLGGEQSCGNGHSRNEIRECYEDPHECARQLLVRQRGNVEAQRNMQIGRVDDAIAKGEKRGEGVAGECGQEKVKDGRPFRLRDAGPGGDHGPPEDPSGGEKAQVFHMMPLLRRQAQREGRWYVPSDQDGGGCEPAKHGIRDRMPEALD